MQFTKFKFKCTSCNHPLQRKILRLYFYFRMIEAALTADPTNTELLQLQSDLNTLITLTKQSMGTLSSNDKVIQ